MLAIKTRMLGMIRYLRPDGNPLRRQIDRTHSRIVLAFAIVVLTACPLVAIMVAQVTYGTERHQAAARHPVQATVVGSPPTGVRSGAPQTTEVQWRDVTGTLRSDRVPPQDGDKPRLRRTIWLDQADRPVPPPNSHLHTVVDAVAASAASVVALGLVLAVTYTLIERRLDRRRFAAWEQEWTRVAPRWTGRP